jgi:hypothetical protein
MAIDTVGTLNTLSFATVLVYFCLFLRILVKQKLSGNFSHTINLIHIS